MLLIRYHYHVNVNIQVDMEKRDSLPHSRMLLKPIKMGVSNII
jgi:hypothetical protein